MILLSEVVKLLTCIMVVWYDSPSTGAAYKTLKDAIFVDVRGMLAMSVPALCYTFQNFMSFLAISNLDVVTYQVTQQLKLITTGMFTVTILGRSLSYMQWGSLVTLMSGVALVQLGFVKLQSGADISGK